MISFNTANDFKLKLEDEIIRWISDVIIAEAKIEGDISYVFCDDDYLLGINREFLKHDTYTDIITFDYSLGSEIHAEIYISTERVQENAALLKVDFSEELHRVLVHGILHLCGYKDKSPNEEVAMRKLEDHYLKLRSFV